MFLNDTFTDTTGVALGSHVGELGATWTESAAPWNTNNAVISANKMRCSTSGTSIFIASGIPGTANYVVEAKLRAFTNFGDGAGVVGRCSSDGQNCYAAVYSAPSNGWFLYKEVAGSFSTIGSYLVAVSAGTDYVIALDMQGSAIKFWLDGVLRISVTDSGVAAAGQAGVFLQGTAPTDSTGLHFYDILAFNMLRVDTGGFLNDLFSDANGTALPSHTGELGATWTETSTWNTNSAVMFTNRMRCGASGTSIYVASGTPGSADYQVEANLRVVTKLGDNIGVVGRCTSDGATCYAATYSAAANGWYLQRQIAGAFVELGHFNQVTVAGTDYVLGLDMQGSSIRLLVNGVARVSATNSEITAAGKAGVFLQGTATDTTGIHFDSITGITTGSAPIVVILPQGYTGATSKKFVYMPNGSGGDREIWIASTLRDIRTRLLTDDCMLGGVSTGVAAWGNDAGLTLVATGHQYVCATYNVKGTVFVGGSMGGLTSLRALRDARVVNVKGWYGIYPACSVLAVYDDISIFDVEILAAWSAANRTALVTALSGKDPTGVSASSYPAIRYRFVASSGDTVILKSTNTDVMRTLLSGTTTVENSLLTASGDHGDLSHLSASDLGDFVTSCFVASGVIGATADIIVLMPADDTVVRMPADDTVVLIPADDATEVM